MVTSLFIYEHSLELTSPEFNGKLENTVMFYDSLILYKHIDNPIKFTISNRDRVRMKTPEDSNINIKFRLLDDRDIVIAEQFLTPIIGKDYFEVFIKKEFTENLETDEDYSFIATMINETVDGEVIETPLYTDHDFSMKGIVRIQETFKDLSTTMYHTTEPYLLYKDYKKSNADDKHVFIFTPKTSHTLYSVKVKSSTMDNCLISVQQNRSTHYPLTQREEQWEEKLLFHHQGETTIPLQMFPERTYFRVIVHATDPSPHYLEVVTINR